MLDFLGEILVGFLELISYGFFSSISKTALEENIEDLKKEEWFKQLYNDYRYQHVIHNTWKVNRYLSKKEKVQLLIDSHEERESFIRWVKDEHERITWGKKKVKQ